MLVVGKLRLDRCWRYKLPLNGFEILFNATREIQKPIFILFESIACMQPAVLNQLRGLVWLLVIPGCTAICPNGELTLVGNLDINPRDSFA